ncbi:MULTISPECIES: guanylate kinase [Halanaerobium]|jgi:guanylate kinase|uniref:Guanylate kinase n=1 Tax=Halanaerobium saccharolyticum TaxID=43595 RepID=A0A4V3CYS2_9FIRM|nr:MULTISPECIES: guanylate kinase [Halanaerobium]PUU87014.1 MAG: guanylate kinase [Halanaerobium sp.]PUU88414.1 MAG: guanylate kinase [Halanaerobium sp.]TDP95258.1 guanylate kinase [Halanaerobium saccharolyticum]
MSKGILFVLSGPSGVGKNTVLDELFKNFDGVSYSVSATTRERREGEVEGEDYFFISEAEFKGIEAEDGFIESAVVHGHYYGTPKKFVDQKLDEGEDIILEIDTQGAKQVREKYPEAVYIFLVPPSLEELENRLDKRGSESDKSKNLRLKNARQELKEVHKYDYEVINDSLSDAVREIKKIIIKEQKRRDSK